MDSLRQSVRLEKENQYLARVFLVWRLRPTFDMISYVGFSLPGSRKPTAVVK